MPAAAQLTASTSRPGGGAAAPALRQPEAVWTFDETTTGNDILWTSPTSVDPTATNFLVLFEITRVDVTAVVIFPITVDVTDQVPPDQLSNGANLAGPAPITIFQSAVVFPAPPEPITVGATIDVGIDAQGSGRLTATNITLGTAEVPSPFGTVNAPITAIRIAGSVAVIPLPWLPLPLQ